MTDSTGRFGDIASSMFSEKTVTLRVYEWANIFRSLETNQAAYRKLQEAFNATNPTQGS